MNKTELLNLIHIYESFVLNEGIIEELSPEIFQAKIEQISNVENQAFSDAAPDWDLLDDSKQSGYFGLYAMNNDGVLKSYIYGFNGMDQIDEMKEVIDEEAENIIFYNGYNIDNLKTFITDMNDGNTFYVSNFASAKQDKDQIMVGKMIISFIDEIKRHGKKYVIFDGRKDTMRLLFGDSNRRETLQIRQKKYKFNLVGTLEQYESHLSLILLN